MFDWTIGNIQYVDGISPTSITRCTTPVPFPHQLQVLPSDEWTFIGGEEECRCGNKVLDFDSARIIYHTLVAHGKKSGEHYAEDFSNKNRSLMSSPGFYRTAETYVGQHGYSLKLDGLEEGINDHARERLIVIHGADYVSESFIRKHGRIGRSWGCPALPLHLSKKMINLIKEGSCLFIYTDDESYQKDSLH